MQGQEAYTEQKVHEYLEWLDEGPQQGADALTTTKQLDESHDAEETEEVDTDDGLARLENEGINLHNHAFFSSLYFETI